MGFGRRFVCLEKKSRFEESWRFLTFQPQGTAIEYDGDKAGGSLASMGWTGKRGDALPPVWVVVHKVC